MELLQVVPLLLAIFAFLTPPASAGLKFGVGDGLALVLFIIIGIVVICALLGWVSRKRAAN